MGTCTSKTVAKVSAPASTAMASHAKSKALKVATWNIAAVNNNPFEYWTTTKDKSYNTTMQCVQDFIENPGDRDRKVSEVFSNDMYGELESKMKKVGWPDETIVMARERWNSDLKDRRIISGFIKDKALGKKRLCSMPDRVTNTVRTLSADSNIVQSCRPTVINMFSEPLPSVASWWAKWTAFMFESSLTLAKGKQQCQPWELFTPISRSKYPDLTEEEEKMSLPLQVACLAIFDAILVHMMGEVSAVAESKGAKSWQLLKQDLCKALRLKTERTLEILAENYIHYDVIFLQEVASTFVQRLKASPALATTFSVHGEMSARDQNSVVLLRKTRFGGAKSSGKEEQKAEEGVRDVTAKAVAGLPAKLISAGDLVVVEAQADDGSAYLLASFHGDTAGLASGRVVEAVSQLHTDKAVNFIFGLDANTHAKGEKKETVQNFLTSTVERLKLASNWGNNPDVRHHTTFNARTYLQPQLNKAVKLEENGFGDSAELDRNLKDWILFSPSQFSSSDSARDNTGLGPFPEEGKNSFLDDIPFPTLDFPSDHAILSACLHPVGTRLI